MKLFIEKIHKDTPLPKMAYQDDAAYDLYAAEEITFQPFETKKVSTGLKIAIPQGHVGLVRDRSGVALKTGLLVKAGVIDSGYRGEWQVVMVNVSNTVEKVEKHTRIAQFLIMPIVTPEIVEQEVLEAMTQRGQGGFGSSGRN